MRGALAFHRKTSTPRQLKQTPSAKKPPKKAGKEAKAVEGSIRAEKEKAAAVAKTQLKLKEPAQQIKALEKEKAEARFKESKKTAVHVVFKEKDMCSSSTGGGTESAAGSIMSMVGSGMGIIGIIGVNMGGGMGMMDGGMGMRGGGMGMLGGA
jgi:ATPase subunit of ABC transporter with duplicated ATPase domains